MSDAAETAGWLRWYAAGNPYAKELCEAAAMLDRLRGVLDFTNRSLAEVVTTKHERADRAEQAIRDSLTKLSEAARPIKSRNRGARDSAGGAGRGAGMTRLDRIEAVIPFQDTGQWPHIAIHADDLRLLIDVARAAGEMRTLENCGSWASSQIPRAALDKALAPLLADEGEA